MKCPKCGSEISEYGNYCQNCGVRLTAADAGVAAVPVKTSGLAIASLVLGILSFFSCGLTFIPAIICGIIALVQISGSGGKLKGKAMAIIGIVLPTVVYYIFMVLVTFVFLTQTKKTSISWITDYDAAVKLASQQNKPLLLVFYKPNTQMLANAFKKTNNTYNNHKVKQFVESNFVPVLISVNEQPDLARRFKVNYYPTHYVKDPENDKPFGPLVGCDPPGLFIKKITELADQINE